MDICVPFCEPLISVELSMKLDQAFQGCASNISKDDSFCKDLFQLFATLAENTLSNT